jgi:hypothetical protein
MLWLRTRFNTSRRRSLDLPLGDVHLEADVVREVARIVVDGCNGDPVPERPAVLAVVADVDGRRPLGLDRLANRRAGLRVRVLTPEEPTASADDLGFVVPGQRLEVVVDEHERVAVAVRVRDRESDRGFADRPRLEPVVVPYRFELCRSLGEVERCLPPCDEVVDSSAQFGFPGRERDHVVDVLPDPRRIGCTGVRQQDER